MKLDEGQIRSIVEKVVIKLVEEEKEPIPEKTATEGKMSGVFPSIDSAVEAASLAQKSLSALSLKKRAPSQSLPLGKQASEESKTK
jgi:hypothetical protein